jgi:PAS domain S-box-containing protein
MSEINVLILEYDLNDIELLQSALRKSSSNFNLKIVDNQRCYEDALKYFDPDIILAGCTLLSFDGISAFKIKRKVLPDVPFIILSRTIGEENAVELIKIGVTDYVHKAKLYQIKSKINRALKEAKVLLENKNSRFLLAQSEKKYKDLFHLSPTPMWVYDTDTYKFLDVNEAAIRIYGYTLAEFKKLKIIDIRPTEDIEEFEKTVKRNKITQRFFKSTFRHIKKNGELLYVSVESNVINFEGKKARLILATDVTDRTNYIRTIEDQNNKLQEIAWIQSHIVRAPLARLMGLINCLQNFQNSENETNELLKHMLSSASELDNVIREIVHTTKEVKISKRNK